MINTFKKILNYLFGNDVIVSILTLIFLGLNLFLNFPITNATLVLTGLWLLLLIIRGDILKMKLDRIYSTFTPTRIIIIFTLLIIWLFFQKFPIQDWNKIIMSDDLTPGYTGSIKGVETLLDGGMFGWDSKMLGGYYMVSDIPMNRSLFLLPFSLIFGHKIGYHAMILLFYIIFPFLCRFYVMLTMKDSRMGAGVFAYSSVFLASFFINLFGMIDNLMGLDLFILNLCLFEKMKNGSKTAPFLLAISISLTMHAHVAFFIYSLLFIGVENVLSRNRVLAWASFFSLGFAFFMTLHYSFYMLYYHNWFTNGVGVYCAPKTFLQQAVNTLKEYRTNLNFPFLLNAQYRMERLGIIVLPATLFALLKGNALMRKIALYLFAVFIINGFGFEIIQLLKARICYLYAFLIPILLSYLLLKNMASYRIQNIMLIPLLILPMTFRGITEPYPHFKSLKEDYSDLYQAVKDLPGNMILFENQAHYNMLSDKNLFSASPIIPGHWESQWSYELKKRLFATTMDSYHFSLFSGNSIQGGAFRGSPLDFYSVDEIKSVLRKWGIEYLVVYSDPSRNYFSKADAPFKIIWQKQPWCIFQFLEADPRSVTLKNGTGELVDDGYFKMKVNLENAAKGDTAIVRENYFPNWTAYSGNNKHDVFNVDGQLAFVVPENGSYEIDLRFPKYRTFSIIALASLVLAFLFFVFPGIFPMLFKDRSPKELKEKAP